MKRVVNSRPQYLATVTSGIVKVDASPKSAGFSMPSLSSRHGIGEIGINASREITHGIKGSWDRNMARATLGKGLAV